MTVRLSISGAFSTGKTTLIEAAIPRLRAAGRQTTMIGEVARQVLAAGYALDRGATVSSYLLYIRQQLAAERSAFEAPLLLSDRSLIDLLAYVLVNDDPAIPVELVDLLAEIVRHETRFFDAYGFLPVEFRPVPDGERAIDPVYQAAVSDRLRTLMDEYGVHVLELRGSVDRRVTALVDFVAARDW